MIERHYGHADEENLRAGYLAFMGGGAAVTSSPAPEQGGRDGRGEGRQEAAYLKCFETNGAGACFLLRGAGCGASFLLSIQSSRSFLRMR